MSGRRRNGQFVSSYDARGLPDAVQAIALHCHPDEPQRLSEREFDRRRSEVSEHASVPTARQICARLGVSWPALLAALFEPGRDPLKFLSANQRAAAALDLTEEHVRFALRLVATRLGLATLRPSQYERGRDDVLAANRRRHRHQQPLFLPNANQIETFAGDWDQALALAGLEPRPAPQGAELSVVSYQAAVRRFLETQGALPTTPQLEAFARAQGFPLPRRPPGGHPQALADVRAEFAAQGRWSPTAAPRKGMRPPYDFESESARLPGERRRVKAHPKDACVEAIVEYLKELKPGEKATQKHYLAWAVRNGRPAPSSFGRHGGWTALLADARGVRRTRQGP